METATSISRKRKGHESAKGRKIAKMDKAKDITDFIFYIIPFCDTNDLIAVSQVNKKCRAEVTPHFIADQCMMDCLYIARRQRMGLTTGWDEHSVSREAIIKHMASLDWLTNAENEEPEPEQQLRQNGHVINYLGIKLTVDFQSFSSTQHALAKLDGMFRDLNHKTWRTSQEDLPRIVNEETKSIRHVMHRFLTTGAKNIHYGQYTNYCDEDCNGPGWLISQCLQLEDAHGKKYHLWQYFDSSSGCG